jgi:hypothetical protein
MNSICVIDFDLGKTFAFVLFRSEKHRRACESPGSMSPMDIDHSSVNSFDARLEDNSQ